MDGILLIDKPAGWTSFDVVAKVRSVMRTSLRSSVVSHQSGHVAKDKRLAIPLPKVKVGHTGTLDPLATGLLVLVLGSYTKRAQEFSKLDKTYEATLKLGCTSTTGDEEGEKTEVGGQMPDAKEVQAVLKEFTGQIEQTPPIYSAMKVGGQRAYKLARAGKEVKLEPRQVTIHNLELTDYSYPIVKLTAHVSSGTYIRSLAQDIGQKLGTGAYLTTLRRTRVGEYDISAAVAVEEINGQMIYQYLKVK